MAENKRGVLIVCTGNSCRSQMAEGHWRRLSGERWRVYSAGSRPSGEVHPWAVRVMRESGIDISGHVSKSIDQALSDAAREASDPSRPIDLVITVCEPARASCPVVAGGTPALHWPFDDPPAAVGTDDERLAVFCRVRDEIAAKIQGFLETDPEG